jgi:hypothetical protein
MKVSKEYKREKVKNQKNVSVTYKVPLLMRFSKYVSLLSYIEKEARNVLTFSYALYKFVLVSSSYIYHKLQQNIQYNNLYFCALRFS